MPKKTHGLGRGLDALLPDPTENSVPVQEIDIGDIDPNPDQPRRTFQEESITLLAQSLREQGVLQPLLVVAADNGRYRIVAGERRWRAARQAGLDTVPCIVREMDVRQQMEIALVENLQREDLNPMEAAQGIRALMDTCGYTQEQVSDRLGKSRPAVANLLRLLTLPEGIAALVRDGKLSAGHGRVLAGVDAEAEALTLAQLAVERGWSVRDLELAAAERKLAGEAAPQRRQPIRRVLTPELSGLEDRVREATGMRTVLTGTEKKGRIVLQYYSREELEHLLEVLDQLDAAGN